MADTIAAKDSVLISTKLACSVPEDYDEFDFQITLHINTVLADLNQLGIGPADGFEVEGPESKWEDFYGTDKRLNSVRSYVYLRVRMLFDPPSTGPLMEAMSKQVEQLLWRINTVREEDLWNEKKLVDPNVPKEGLVYVPVVSHVIDGGDP